LKNAEPAQPYWNPTVPELTVSSLEASLEFYTTVLGFSVRFQRPHPPFAYLERGPVQVMLEEEHSQGWHTAPLERPLGRGLNLQMEIEDVSTLQAALERVHHPLFRPLLESWYATSEFEQEGQLEFLVQDPDGYLLRFLQVLGTRKLPSGLPEPIIS
jgi:catechol 2,3-dioxygenase-like lactoylglutathione lyase family enzyme